MFCRVPRCWRGLARCFRTLDGFDCRVVVRWAVLLPCERNGRVSGVWMAWVGRLRARASNCWHPILFIVPGCAVTALRVRLVSCVAYLAKGIGWFCLSLSAPCPRGWWGGRKASLVFLACLAPLAWLPWPMSCSARALGCRMLCAGAGSLGLCLPKQRISSLDTNDCRARLERPRAARPVGPHAGVGVAKECYLVDPASSHMLVSKIKPCMCKYELIQTVKLRMAH
jgi:hypothetical protein